MTLDRLDPQLQEGLSGLGLALAPAQQHDLIRLIGLLKKWNSTYNLTAIRDPQAMLVQHVLDALAILPWLGTGDVLDVGSGAGIPGLVLAIARPELGVTLVDAVQKKVSFQQQALIELGLVHRPRPVKAVHARVEELSGSYAQIVSRAFSDLATFTSLTRHLLAPGGRWLAMKGALPHGEVDALPAGIRVIESPELTVPGLAARRHLLILEDRP